MIGFKVDSLLFADLVTLRVKFESEFCSYKGSLLHCNKQNKWVENRIYVELWKALITKQGGKVTWSRDQGQLINI